MPHCLCKVILGDVALGQLHLDAMQVLAQLTPRQREVIALAASGYDAVGIAERLHLAHVSVRRELSLAYRVLVPEPKPGTDLRTAEKVFSP